MRPEYSDGTEQRSASASRPALPVWTSNTFGHPSVYGYKDICKNWVIDKWDPSGLMDLYVQMGAKFFMAMGSHHDNFDCWDSAYQPWNSARIGVKVDMIGAWALIARQKGMRFGIGFQGVGGHVRAVGDLQSATGGENARLANCP